MAEKNIRKPAKDQSESPGSQVAALWEPLGFDEDHAAGAMGLYWTA